MEQLNVFEYEKGDRSKSGPCPHCGMTKREWRKGVISTAGASLVRLVALYRGEPVHLDKFTVLAKDRNFSQLVLWGLIEPARNVNSDKRALGMWTPTQLGINFAKGETCIKKYVVTVDNAVVRFEGPEVAIADVLGKRFSYSELKRLQN